MTRVSGAARRAGRAARTYLHRDARGGAWTPGAGVDTGRASLGLTRRAAVRARHRARQILDKIAASRVNDFARSGGNLRFSQVSRLRHDRLPAHATARRRRRRPARERSLRGDGEVRDTPRGRSNARARASLRVPDLSTPRFLSSSSPNRRLRVIHNGRELVLVVVARSRAFGPVCVRASRNSPRSPHVSPPPVMIPVMIPQSLPARGVRPAADQSLPVLQLEGNC